MKADIQAANPILNLATVEASKRQWHLKAGAFEVWIVREARTRALGNEIFLTLPFKVVDGCQMDYEEVMTRAHAVAHGLNMLGLARQVHKEALPKFNWGASALDANAIDLLIRFGSSIAGLGA